MQQYDSPGWCGLTWTPWTVLEGTNRLSTLPNKPGLYQVRPVGQDFLLYIGQTGRSVQKRLTELGVFLKDPETMPFNDPHTAAPSLWAWRDAEGWDCEVSGAAFPGDKREREGMEAYLLWQYRLKRGESTLCNFGRFHEGYIKSRDRRTGFRGGKLPAGERNPAGGPSIRPLKRKGQAIDPDWMDLPWSRMVPLTRPELRNIDIHPCLYRIFNHDATDLIYIGQTKNARNRLSSHRRSSHMENAMASIYSIRETILPHHLIELENDLIGAYFEEKQTVPVLQIGGQQQRSETLR